MDKLQSPLATDPELKLRQRRRRLGISQALLARLVGVSTVSIHLWEKESHRPNKANSRSLRRTLSGLERGLGQRCPSGHWLGRDYKRHAECEDCAHHGDCLLLMKRWSAPTAGTCLPGQDRLR